MLLLNVTEELEGFPIQNKLSLRKQEWRLLVLNAYLGCCSHALLDPRRNARA